MKMMKRYLIAVALFFTVVGQVLANAVVVSSVTRQADPNRDKVQFTISWQNSWLVGGNPGNHDAVWVFIKFKRCDVAASQYSHARLSTTMADHTLSSGLAFARSITTTDRLGNAGTHNTGVLIRRSAVGVGHVTNETVTLDIVGATDGATFDPLFEYDIQVYAIEMVQIPAGGFAFGCDNVAATLSCAAIPTSGGYNNTLPTVNIGSEAGFSFTQHCTGWGYTVGANYPKGFNEFYCMKYEISAGQYADFLNNIGSMSSARHNAVTGTNRHAITAGTTGYSATDPNRANNFMDEEDMMAYLDWAALRPMTEMEYEKVCKGGIFQEGGYAWGLNSSSLVEALQVTTPEDGTETVATANANIHCRGAQVAINNTSAVTQGDGPLGCGIFARNGSETRTSAGASYYGVMEMSGNVWEYVVNLSTDGQSSSNNAYTGVWGDGILGATGSGNTANWPAANTWQNGWRGGAWDTHINGCIVTSRAGCNTWSGDPWGGSGNYFIRLANRGGRGVR